MEHDRGHHTDVGLCRPWSVKTLAFPLRQQLESFQKENDILYLYLKSALCVGNRLLGGKGRSRKIHYDAIIII